ncbi:hypothetical protein AVEN_260155-1, partial [Araneus ventricosus]
MNLSSKAFVVDQGALIKFDESPQAQESVVIVDLDVVSTACISARRSPIDAPSLKVVTRDRSRSHRENKMEIGMSTGENAVDHRRLDLRAIVRLELFPGGISSRLQFVQIWSFKVPAQDDLKTDIPVGSGSVLSV